MQKRFFPEIKTDISTIIMLRQSINLTLESSGMIKLYYCIANLNNKSFLGWSRINLIQYIPVKGNHYNHPVFEYKITCHAIEFVCILL